MDKKARQEASRLGAVTATPTVDAALAYTSQGTPPGVIAHPEKWLVNVARELETALRDLIADLELRAKMQDPDDPVLHVSNGVLERARRVVDGYFVVKAKT